MIEPSVREARFTPEEMSVTEDELKERRDPDGTVSYYHPDQPTESATTKEALLRKLKQYREPERHATHLNRWKPFCDSLLGSEEAWPSFEYVRVQRGGAFFRYSNAQKIKKIKSICEILHNFTLFFK